MINVDIPKDIRKYETRVVGPLSLRQTICGGIAIALCALFYKFVAKPMELQQDIMFFGFFAIAVIPLMIGWIKPYGIPFEDFARVAILTSFVFPSKRVYKTVNIGNPNRKPIPKDKPADRGLTKQAIARNPDLQAFK